MKLHLHGAGAANELACFVKTRSLVRMSPYSVASATFGRMRCGAANHVVAARCGTAIRCEVSMSRCL